MSKTCIILGKNSDIANGLTPLLERDGWAVHSWRRGVPPLQWDLIISCIGTVAPVGLWHELAWEGIQQGIETNLLTPIALVRLVIRLRNPGASVCFLAGSNPNMIMPGYFAYNVSKMALLKAVEQMDYETPDAKFFALGPGTILTKIHQATLEARWQNPKLAAALDDDADQQPKIQRVYDTLKWCIEQEKDVIGGRNICASDPWDRPTWNGDSESTLANALWTTPDLFKLRRYE